MDPGRCTLRNSNCPQKTSSNWRGISFNWMRSLSQNLSVTTCICFVLPCSFKKCYERTEWDKLAKPKGTRRMSFKQNNKGHFPLQHRIRIASTEMIWIDTTWVVWHLNTAWVPCATDKTELLSQPTRLRLRVPQLHGWLHRALAPGRTPANRNCYEWIAAHPPFNTVYIYIKVCIQCTVYSWIYYILHII